MRSITTPNYSAVTTPTLCIKINLMKELE